jgi:hypothetical protein
VNRNFRSLLALTLLSMHGHTDEPIKLAPLEPDWWDRFVREMGALGCVNVRRNLTTGEFEFDCPAEKVQAARAIVKRYSVK